MLEPNRRDQSQDDSSRDSQENLVREVLDEPSVFVASLVDLLVKRKSESSLRVADIVRREGILSGRDFNRLVESVADPALCSELLWAYSYITKRVVDSDFAQGFPALITLTHKCLTSPDPVDRGSQRRLSIILDRVLDARVGSDDVSDRLAASQSVSDRGKLESIATCGFQDRLGYWEALEILSATHPDTKSLESVFRAVDRLGARPYSRGEREAVTRCVAAAAVGDLEGAFRFIAQALGDSDTHEGTSLRTAAAAGLAFHVDKSVDVLSRSLGSQTPGEVMLASRVCIMADRDPYIEFSREEREALAHELHAVLGSVSDHVPHEPLVDIALAALAHVSPELDDVEHVGEVIQSRLRSTECTPSALVSAYARGLARVHNEFGIVGLKPISARRVAALSSNPPLMNAARGAPLGVMALDTDSVFENLALEIAGASGMPEVLDLCQRHQHIVDLRSLRPRSNDSTSLFYDLVDAARFSRFYAEISERGPVEFAALLLPEFLSALRRGSEAEREMLTDFIGDNAIRSLAALTSVISNNSRLRDLAIARMGGADWEMLASFHKESEREFPGAYPDLGLAVFAVRSVIEDDKGWQSELLGWWRKVSDRDRGLIDENALAFVSVAAERVTPGTAMELLRMISLTKDDDVTFADTAVGLMIHPQESIQKGIELASSARAHDMARGLRIGQLMARELNDTQRGYFVSWARRAMDEMGILSLDAACAVGAISSSREDALLLLTAEPALGVSETVHKVSCARAAANVIRNLERRGG